ncbi:MAG: hypothetical protein SGILL_008538, partial [Bacillariaceae sp.]
MDAFTEALREKRSVFWHLTHHASVSHNRSLHSRSNVQNAAATAHSRGSSFNSSFLSGSTASTTTNTAGDDESTTFSNKDPAGQDAVNNVHDKAIDELVDTLKSMGNVHSLRGEQDEAMRYFTEVTSLRAQKKGAVSVSVACDASVDTRSFLSGLNDDNNSALMSEINEDVKALDDLFQSISFRNNGKVDSDTTMNGSCTEKRKSKSGTPSNKKHKVNTSPRTSSSTQATT